MNDLIAQVRRIAWAAGEKILLRYRTELAVTVKADASPVTTADMEADALIAGALRELSPDIPVVSEEGGVPDYSIRRNWRRFWLVDPLDGTKEFLRRSDDFTVNIALIEGDAPILGVVYAPALGTLYYAQRHRGAWRNRGGHEQRLQSEPSSDDRGLVVVESRSHPSAGLERFLSAQRVRTRIQIGSSLKFCRVAEGAADVYPRFGPTMEWDTAAGDCIYRFSGRSGPRPSPLTYNKPSLRNADFVIGSDALAVIVP